MAQTETDQDVKAFLDWADEEITKGRHRYAIHRSLDYCDGSSESIELGAAKCRAHPALLAACEAAKHAMGLHGPCEQNDCRECQCTYQKIRAAIAAAKEDDDGTT